MPRITKGQNFYFSRYRDRSVGALTSNLADELKSDRKFGQPLIEEKHFPTGLISVSVLWDRWQGINLQERPRIITQAYDLAETKDIAEKVRLATGSTFPEALNSGMFSHQIILALRDNDPFSESICRRAMIEEGASMLVDPIHPRLLFPTEGQAAASRDRLIERLPDSEPIWLLDRLIMAGFESSENDDI